MNNKRLLALAASACLAVSANSTMAGGFDYTFGEFGYRNVDGDNIEGDGFRAAISFGASKWYLLTRVDLPLASPSIRAGINQTIMLSLAMVVVASLIGAKGLGEDVLEALQYANVGQGILAGFAILFCAMILDRIVQGARK